MTDDRLDVTGGCHCGAVRFRAAGVTRAVTECHCSQCRKQAGHRYAVVEAETSHTAIEGADKITWYRASPAGERGFCSLCGSTLFWKGSGDDFFAILAAAIDAPNDLVMAKHIFVESKGGYYEIADGLPQHEGHDQPISAT